MWLRKKALVLAALFGALLISGSWLPHKFYVSLTELRYNTRTERYEVSMRIFPDDLDRALLERSGIRTQLATELEHERADSLLKTYLLENITIRADGREIPLNYLGKEPESDAVWCYLESDPFPAPGDLYIRHDLLTEIFPEQVNIVQVYVEDWNKGLMLNRNQNSGQLTVGE